MKQRDLYPLGVDLKDSEEPNFLLVNTCMFVCITGVFIYSGNNQYVVNLSYVHICKDLLVWRMNNSMTMRSLALVKLNVALMVTFKILFF